MDWSRRDVLAGLGVGAAATLLSTIGCGGSALSTRKASAHRVDGDDVRAWLRRAVEQLRAEHPIASAHAVVARRISAAIDLRGRGVVHGQRAALVLRVDDGRGRIVERATGELTSAAVDRLVGALRAARTPGRAPALRFAAPVRQAPVGGAMPDLTEQAWLAYPGALAERADRAANSRVVYRGAWTESDDVTIWHVASGPGGELDREQQLVRTRSGLVLMSWSGTSPMIGQVERGAVGGPDQVVVTDADVKAAARGALELMTPGQIIGGIVPVVLMPSVVARLADVAIAPLLTTAGWSRADLLPRKLAGQPVGGSLITIRADPDPARYGGYHFDDEGTVAAATAVIEAGVLRAPVGDARGVARMPGAIAGGAIRPGHTGVAGPAIGHLAWAPGPGAADADQLISELDDAWVVDDAGAAHVDPATWWATIEVGRARKVARGAFTGHVYAGVELTVAIPALLAATTKVSSTLETFIVRDGDGADVRWRSLEVPALVSRATLAPRRPA